VSHALILTNTSLHSCQAYGGGTPICSGDVLTFRSLKTISGSRYVLHMSHLKELEKDRHIITHALKIDHSYIRGGQEINAISDYMRPTQFRAMLFSRMENSDPTATEILKGEDVVSFYHKQMSAYLSYDPLIQSSPMFYKSDRISNNARKKCSW
jgi:hypothetical protein